MLRGLTGVRSKYEEDLHEHGHTSVWGSYWHPILGWGYRCCLGFDKKSKCRGEEGKVDTIKREYDLEIQAKSEKERVEKLKIEEQNKRYQPTVKPADELIKEEE